MNELDQPRHSRKRGRHEENGREGNDNGSLSPINDNASLPSSSSLKTASTNSESHDSSHHRKRRQKRRKLKDDLIAGAEPDPEPSAEAVVPASDSHDTDYWKDLAEQRRIALEEALTENERLTEKVESLEAENRDLEEMLTEAKTLAEMINTLNEGVEASVVDDSGIGKDLSTTLSTSTESTE